MIDKNTIRVNFDAKDIEARDLVNNGWMALKKLAVPCVDPALNVSALHVRDVGRVALLSTLLTITMLIVS